MIIPQNGDFEFIKEYLINFLNICNQEMFETNNHFVTIGTPVILKYFDTMLNC
jgi:hypothetical protein